ncbi:phosphoadenylyl-sulfate reductase [Bosea sp. 117]|uniref:phosphoadenylyl-sulfate reductase n=1 Tax=Bosea sp. 117 TaxID=1125973 RepID=UPI0004945428|nr:phosphoadenylyl-sulfate reductase [Bosea sp. 117]
MNISAIGLDFDELRRDLEGASPREIVEAATNIICPGRLGVVSSFGTESAALLAYVAEVDPSIPVVFLDTGWLFEETLAYRDDLVARLGLTDVRSIRPDPDALAERDPNGDLWFSNPDACCFLRKVEPLARALKGFDGWFNGRKRYHGGQRSAIPVIEQEGNRLKFNPLANATRDEVEGVYDRLGLPRHPLAAQGFTSVGCMPCTSRTKPGDDLRSGRWAGRSKSECGIHTVPTL